MQQNVTFNNLLKVQIDRCNNCHSPEFSRGNVE